jgi:HK97 family phage major capsid protein
MPYNNDISRTEAAALIPEDYSHEIIKGAIAQSAALSLFRHVPMSRAQTRMPVESVLPIAYFVNGDTGLKQSTEQNWTNKYLNAEEVAVIVPVPDAVLDDVDFDLWAEVMPRLVESVGRAIDAAVFFGTNKPASWPTEIVTAAISAGNVVDRTDSDAAHGGIAGDISALFAKIEADGFDVNGIIASRTYRGFLRDVRDTLGQPIREVNPTDAYGVNITYPLRGLWAAPGAGEVAELIAGDFTQGILGIRQDITWATTREGVIQDNTGAIIFNTFQQDMTAIRVVMRIAFQVPNPVNYDQPTEANRYPFGVLESPS